MVGPVLTQELLLGSRRGRQQVFRRIYTGWLVLQLLFFYWLYVLNANVIGNWFFGSGIDPEAACAFASSFVDKLVWQQFLLLLLATPAFTAGAITDEKVRGTLQYLLTGDLLAWEIVMGKLLGRLAQMALLMLTVLPILCFIGVFAGLNLTLLVALAAVTAAPLFTVGSASLLASVWSKQTRDAVLVVYLCGSAVFALLWVTGTLDLFDPLHVLEPTWGERSDLGELAWRLMLSTAAWGSIGVTCLLLAVWRLRPAYRRQLEGAGRPKRVRWWRGKRAALAEEPIFWKERDVEGIAPSPALRLVPRWLGVALVFLLTVVSSVAILAAHVGQSLTAQEFWESIVHVRFVQLASHFTPAEGAFLGQSVAAMLAATLLVGVRCSGAISGERERQTWEALLLTPLAERQLIRGKLRGIVGASYPYVMAYAVPAVLMSLLGGWRAPLWTMLWLGVTWLALRFVGAAGLWCSVRAKSSWRSLLGTVSIAYVGGFVLYAVAWPLAAAAFLIILLTLAVIDWLNSNQTAFAQWFSGTFGFYLFATCLALVAGFLGMTSFFLADAQKYVAARERIRHWEKEPEEPGSRRRLPQTAKQPLEVDETGT